MATDTSNPAEKEMAVPPGVKLLQAVSPTRINNVIFKAMNIDYEMEKFQFNGVYAMMRRRNPHSKLEFVLEECYGRTIEHMRNKSVFVEGNILYKENDEGVKDAIDLMIRATSMKKLPSCVDTSVLSRKQMVGGTVCPTRDVIFRYKGMLFIVYGRYIYGYDSPYVRFVNENIPKDNYEYTAEHYEDCKKSDKEKTYFWEIRRKPVISCDEIILPTVSYSEKVPLADDYNYSFCILEEASNTLLAFAVYR